MSLSIELAFQHSVAIQAANLRVISAPIPPGQSLHPSQTPSLLLLASTIHCAHNTTQTMKSWKTQSCRLGLRLSHVTLSWLFILWPLVYSSVKWRIIPLSSSFFTTPTPNLYSSALLPLLSCFSQVNLLEMLFLPALLFLFRNSWVTFYHISSELSSLG